jgi:hypothetical protein
MSRPSSTSWASFDSVQIHSVQIHPADHVSASRPSDGVETVGSAESRVASIVSRTLNVSRPLSSIEGVDAVDSVSDVERRFLRLGRLGRLRFVLSVDGVDSVLDLERHF